MIQSSSLVCLVISAIGSLLLGTATPPLISAAACQDGGGFTFCRAVQRVYIQKSARYVSAIDLASLTQRWVADLGAAGISSNIGVAGDTVAFGYGPSEMRALSAASGTQLWSMALRTRQVEGSGANFIAQTHEQEGITAVSAGGELRWKSTGEVTTDPRFLRILDISEEIAITSAFSIDTRTGELLARWTEAATAALIVSDTQLLVHQSGNLRGYRGQTQLWFKAAQFPAAEHATVELIAVADGFVAICAARDSRQLLRIERRAMDGSVVWNWNSEQTAKAGDTRTTGRLGSVGVAGNVLFLALVRDSNESELMAFSLSKGHRVWSRGFRFPLVARRGFEVSDSEAFVMADDGGLPVLLTFDVASGRVIREMRPR